MKLSAAVRELSQKLSDDAENNTVIATADSNCVAKCSWPEQDNSDVWRVDWFDDVRSVEVCATIQNTLIYLSTTRITNQWTDIYNSSWC